MRSIQEYIQSRLRPNISIRMEAFREEQPQEHPRHLHECPFDKPSSPCGMCNEFERKIIRHNLAKTSLEVSRSLKVKQQSRLRSQPMQFILKRLLMPHHKMSSQSLGVCIPETCFYQDGEATILYMNIDPPEHNPEENKPRSLEQTIIRIKKERLTNTLIQKTFNDKRRKYRERMGTALKRRTSRRKGEEKFGKKEPPPDTKDAVIVRYTDGTQQLYTQNWFIGLTLKRKTAPIFKEIECIKNFIGVSDEDQNMLFITYRSDDVKYPHLMERSRTLMRVYGGNILEQEDTYISNEQEVAFMRALRWQSLDALAHYTIYRIVSYIEYFYDERITMTKVKLLLNQRNQLYLLHVYEEEHTSLVKYNWTENTYNKKVEEAEAKLLNRRSKVQLSDHYQHRSQLIQAEMWNEYETTKIAKGLGEVEKDDTQEKANNAFFAMLHPQLKQSISQALRDKGMTLQKFKKNIMGQHNRKKPVAQHFNSNMVKALHRMAPPIKVAVGHQIENSAVPRTPTASQRSEKRAVSMGLTMSTINRTQQAVPSFFL